ncbi:MAG: hypothetical protein IPL87_01850 [Candidatus Moraniibacteriota bacterium]|nr:MAG: hypothetical protein IPL87_01850 [Candidatus Moranbacteria bacterium]
MVGGNWVVASSEDELKEILARQSTRTPLDIFSSQSTSGGIAENTDFKKVESQLEVRNASETLFTAYLNIPSKIFLGKEENCSGDDCFGLNDFLRYPERIVLGWSADMNEKGINVRWTGPVQEGVVLGKPVSESLATRLPEKANNAWLNVYVEGRDVKKRFYDFKRLVLTDCGREEWEKFRGSLRSSLGVDPEDDFIGHLSGSASFSIVTNGDQDPQAVFTMHVDNREAIREFIRKGTDAIRNALVAERASLETVSPPSFCKAGYDCTSPFIQGILNSNESKKKELDELIRAANITETVTPEGTIFSFKLSNTVPYSFLSFDFAFRDDLFIFGSHFASTEAFLREIGPQSKEKKLSQSDFYRETHEGENPNSYQTSFLVMNGVWDVVNYGFRILEREVWGSSPSSSSAELDEVRNLLFATGAVVRTVRMMGNETFFRDGFQTSLSRFFIDPLPIDEKKRASDILERLPRDIESKRNEANRASFKAEATSMVPRTLLVCDGERNITKEEIFGQREFLCTDTNSFAIQNQKCGPDGDGTFQFTVVSTCLPTPCTATVTQNGITFSPC